MKKYGLIGKNISHSKSPEVYKKLITEEFHYELLDYVSEDDLPSVSYLMKNYNGINITAPYKRHYYQQVELTADAKKVGAINCLSFKNGKCFGTNTDYLAFKKLLREKLVNNYAEVIILGSGAMAKMVQLATSELGLTYRTIARNTHGPLENYDFKEPEIKIGRPVLYVNCCSRQYIFKSQLINPLSLFWDMNYSNFDQEKMFSSSPEQYEDGYSLLVEQARFAVQFWSTI